MMDQSGFNAAENDNIINVITQILCYSDGIVSDNPHMRAIDHRRRLESIGCRNPYGNEVVVGPGQSFSLFSTIVSTLLNGSSTVSMDPVNTQNSAYRLTVNSGPSGLRTPRTVSGLAGCTVTVNNNAVAVFSFTGAVYQNNGQNFIVNTSITGGTTLVTTGSGAPSAGPGTLTLAFGVGDSTISYSSFVMSGTNTYTFTVSPANATAAPNLSAVQVGDLMRINGQLTYDTAPYAFNPINSGTWQVASTSTTSSAAVINAIRLPGVEFAAVQETVPAPTGNDVMFFANDGVMPGMMFQVTGTFSEVTQRTYQVQESTPNFIGFVSTQPIPQEDGLTYVPNTITFYTGIKKLVYVEADQQCAVRFNGQTDSLNLITPIKPADRYLRGFMTKWGDTYSCTVVNESLSQSKVKFFTVE